MKKIIAYLSIVVAFVISIDILKILTTEFDRLTEYGLGYLTGKLILLTIFLSLIYLSRGIFRAKKTAV